METVISVSAYNSKGKVSNGEWESILAETMILNDGDGIVIKDAYIDTRTRSSDDIYIEEDITLYISHYYYYVNNVVDNNIFNIIGLELGPAGLANNPVFNTFDISTSGTNFKNLTVPDGLPYMLMMLWYPFDINTHSYPSIDSNGNPIAKVWTPVVGVWNYTLPAGSYSKDYLATLITQKMTKVIPALYTADNSVGQKFEFPMGLTDMSSDAGVAAKKNNFVIQPIIKWSGTNNVYQYYIDMAGGPLQNSQFLPGSLAMEIPACYVSIVNQDGRTNQAYSPPYQYIIYPYYIIEKDRLNYSFEQYNNNLIAPLAGATEMSLIYNNQNNGIYSFDYLHTPILVAGKEVVMVSTYPLSAGLNFLDMAMSDRQAGIIIYKLEPSFFWGDILGFDVDALDGSKKFSTIPGDPQINWDDYQSLTTGNFWGISMIYDPRLSITVGTYKFDFPSSFRDTMYRQYFDNDPGKGYNGTLTWESDSTNMIEAVNMPINPTDTGHFLIELTGYSTNYFDENDAYQVKSIVSSYYITANSFATAPFPDSFIYQHHGEPLIIGSLKVRILSPKTKKVLPIGPNSTIYLQVSQQLTPVKVQQPDF